MHKGYFKTAAFLGALSVLLGAMGSHAIKKMVTADAFAIYETAVRYQFYHVFALAIAAIVFKYYPNKLIKASSILFIAGIVCFSGSLYLITYQSIQLYSIPRWEYFITPVGGLSFIAGWICLLLSVKENRLTGK